MTHYCPKCKSTHTMWTKISYGKYICYQCGYILVHIKIKNSMEILNDITEDMREKKFEDLEKREK